MSKLLAPNGKPSNLTVEQYKLVRTPAFKEWFGDWENDPENASKIVDENGEPLAVFHGTNFEFNEFDYSQTQKNDIGFVGKGFYFTPKKTLALAYAERQHDKAIWSDNKKINISKVIVKSFFLSIKTAKVVNEPEDIGINYYKSEIGDKLEKEKIVKISDNLKKQGYQGVIWHRDNCNGCLNGRKHWEYVVFEPNQIKLADGTNTTFDGGNPDIRFDEGGKIEDSNGYLSYTINEDEITLDMIKSYDKRKGTATKLIEKLKDLSRQNKLPIGLYAEPQDSSISDNDLIEFYYKNGFELDPNDYDGKLFIWNYSNGGEIKNTGLFSQIWEWFGIKF